MLRFKPFLPQPHSSAMERPQASISGALSSAQSAAMHEFAKSVRSHCLPDEAVFEANAPIDAQIVGVFATTEKFSEVDISSSIHLTQRFFNDKGTCLPRWELKEPTTVYLSCVTKEGSSLMIRAKDFYSWIYVEIPGKYFKAEQANWYDSDCGDAVDPLPIETLFGEELCSMCKIWGGDGLYEVKYSIHRKELAYGWVSSELFPTRPKRVPCIKLMFASESHRSICTSKLTCTNTFLRKKYFPPTCKLASLAYTTSLGVYDSTMPAETQFMLTYNLTQSGWIHLTEYTSTLNNERLSYCNYEVVCSASSLINNAERSSFVAPLLMLSFDIECQSDKGTFPSPLDCPVSYIGMALRTHGKNVQKEEEKPSQVMLVLGTSDPVPGKLVLNFVNEVDLIFAFRDIVVAYLDPDIITGYNIWGFDAKYLYWRLCVLIGRDTFDRSSFNFWSRLVCLKMKHFGNTETLDEKAGSNLELRMSGRVGVDMLAVVQKAEKMSSYKLDVVAKKLVPDSVGKLELFSPGWSAAAVKTFVDILDESQILKAGAYVLPEAVSLMNALLILKKHSKKCYLVWENTALLGDTGSLARKKLEAVESKQSKELAALLKDLIREYDSFAASNTGLELKWPPDVMQEFNNACVATGDDNYKRLFVMYRMGDLERSAIAHYCFQDTSLPLDIAEKLSVVFDAVLTSQVTSTTLGDIMSKGQTVKVCNQLFRACVSSNYVVNIVRPPYAPPPPKGSAIPKKKKYKGATVLEPIVGFYETPVATLDFNSLYPSIMIANNLCMSTFIKEVTPATQRLIDSGGVSVFSVNGIGESMFVKSSIVKGVLPKLLENLLSNRKATRVELAAESLASKRVVLNARQLALKVSANSIYGFCGATVSAYSCLPIAASVTYIGRTMIEATRRHVEANFSGTKVIYGDTDSVMINLESMGTVQTPEALKEIFRLAPQMAAECTELFPKPIRLEFEKVYWPYLLHMKKSYAGKKYEGSPEAAPKLDKKGIKCEKRDTPPFLKNVLNDSVRCVVVDQNRDGVADIVLPILKSIVNGTLSVSSATASKKRGASYVSQAQSQLQVVLKMQSRGALNIPGVGDRVPFVIVENSKENKVSMRAEDPDFVSRNRLSLDRQYYLDQLEKTLEVVLKHLPCTLLKTSFKDAHRSLERRALGMSSINRFCVVRPRENSKLELKDEEPKAKRVCVNKNRVVQMTLQGLVAPSKSK